jgi:hypothetical protein
MLLAGCRSGPEQTRANLPPPSPVVEVLDLNKDGILDATELAAAPRSLLTLDKNGDGRLSYDEIHRTDIRQPPGDPPPILMALDVNRDDEIDSNEIANASAALKTLDKNGDGQLSGAELLPPTVAPQGVPPAGRYPAAARP